MALNPTITDWQGQRVWLLGASTGIGLALAKSLHARGARVAVSARNASALDAFVAAHPSSLALPLDATQAASVQEAAQHMLRVWGGMDLVMYCAGHYKAQSATAFDLQEMLRHDQINYVGALHMLAATLPTLLAQKQGHVSLIASVAGYRGLPKSLAYGPTKAALINLAEALYIDLHDQGLGVSLVCPGFVETPLTAQNEFHMPALIKPEQAARAIIEGWARGAFEMHFPKRFTSWVKALRQLPYAAYFFTAKRVKGV
jgi:NAD(P)-dependent dehydrogenase (short-subunit alcohol dehydrogenase family)